MNCEDVSITTSDGIKLHGLLFKQKHGAYETAPTLIYLGGNAENIGLSIRYFQKIYNKCKINILAISYRGYGNSEGKPTEYGVYRDAEAAVDYLLSRSDISYRKIFVLGRSLGGAVAIELAYRRSSDLQGVIVENTFTSLLDMIHHLIPFLRYFTNVIKPIQRLHMNSIQKMPNIHLPFLFISGQKDALVPPIQMKRLYNSCVSTIKDELLVLYGKHDDTWLFGGDHYYNKVNEFISNALSAASNSAISSLHNKYIEKNIEDKNKIKELKKLDKIK